MTEAEMVLRGYRLVTVKIYYQNPDAPWLINRNWWLWQKLDLPPRLPRLNKFLRWWNDTLDGKLVKVRVALSTGWADLTHVKGEYRLS